MSYDLIICCLRVMLSYVRAGVYSTFEFAKQLSGQLSHVPITKDALCLKSGVKSRWSLTQKTTQYHDEHRENN